MGEDRFLSIGSRPPLEEGGVGGARAAALSRAQRHRAQQIYDFCQLEGGRFWDYRCDPAVPITAPCRVCLGLLLPPLAPPACTPLLHPQPTRMVLGAAAKASWRNWWPAGGTFLKTWQRWWQGGACVGGRDVCGRGEGEGGGTTEWCERVFPHACAGAEVEVLLLARMHGWPVSAVGLCWK